MPKTASGKCVIKILTREYGFSVVSQKGSHVKLKKKTLGGDIITVVPLHTELAHGTFRGVLELARIDFNDFVKFL